jgi:hypothetical protein
VVYCTSFSFASKGVNLTGIQHFYGHGGGFGPGGFVAGQVPLVRIAGYYPYFPVPAKG